MLGVPDYLISVMNVIWGSFSSSEFGRMFKEQGRLGIMRSIIVMIRICMDVGMDILSHGI